MVDVEDGPPQDIKLRQASTPEIVDSHTTNSKIQKMNLKDLAYGGYDILKKRKIKLGSYNKNTDKFTSSGEKFIMINLETNAALGILMRTNKKNEPQTIHWPGHNRPIVTTATTISNAVGLYGHKENGYFCFSVRERQEKFEPGKKNDKDKKIHLTGRKNNQLYFYSYLDLKKYRGFEILEDPNYQNQWKKTTGPLKYCTRYKIRQANNTRKDNQNIFINVNNEKGHSFFNPNNLDQNGDNTTIIFFPYLDPDENTCLSFEPDAMRGMIPSDIWKGPKPNILLNRCRSVMARFCSTTKKSGVGKYPVLSDACFDFYQDVFKDGVNDKDKREMDEGITEQCYDLYKDKLLKLEKCACLYPMFEMEAQDNASALDIKNAHCFYSKCRENENKAYKINAQKTVGCPKTLCYVGNVEAKSLTLVQACDDEDDYEDIDDDDFAEDPTDDDEDVSPRPTLPDRGGDKEEAEKEKSAGRLRLVMNIGLVLSGIFIIAIIVYILVRNRRNRN